MILSYDGAEFSGWQVQPDANTVQGTLASAIGRITGEKVLPQGSGRTDAGVHALAQVMTFVTGSSIPTENFLKAMNDILPAAVRVLQVTEAPADFHARHSARAKTYRYRIYREPICPPFLPRYVWHYPYPLGEDEMARSAALVVGQQARLSELTPSGPQPIISLLMQLAGMAVQWQPRCQEVPQPQQLPTAV